MRPKPAVTPQAWVSPPGCNPSRTRDTCTPFRCPSGSLLHAPAWEPHSGPLPQLDLTAVPAPHPEARCLLEHGCGAPAAGQDPAGCAEMGLPGLACLGRRLHRTLPPAQKAGAAGGRLGVSDTPFLLPPLASRRRPRREGDLDASAGLGLDGWGRVRLGDLAPPTDRRKFFFKMSSLGGA